MTESGSFLPGPPPETTIAAPSQMRRAGLASAVMAMVLGLVVLAAAVTIVVANYGHYRISAKSMSPTLDAGDRIVIRKGVGEQVQRGDIVAFDAITWSWVDVPGTTFVKRVVGAGGDTVRCCDYEGRITVNALPVDEPYLYREAQGGEGLAQFGVEVPNASIFVLGDFRAQSADSRMDVGVGASGQGAIPVGDIEGIVVAVNFRPISTTTAFADAGLPASREGDVIQWPVFYAIIGAAVLSLLGLIGLITGLVRRSGAHGKALT